MLISLEKIIRYLFLGLACVAVSCTSPDSGRYSDSASGVTGACEGEMPTEWYMRDIAPTLPVWQRTPDRKVQLERSHLYYGTISTRQFERYSSQQLQCWANDGDKLAALAAAEMIGWDPSARYGAGHETVEQLLRIASEDNAPGQPCAQAFCHGVPEAMYRLAIFRGLRDREYRSLLERANRAGFVLARYELSGRPLPSGNDVIDLEE